MAKKGNNQGLKNRTLRLPFIEVFALLFILFITYSIIMPLFIR